MVTCIAPKANQIHHFCVNKYSSKSSNAFTRVYAYYIKQAIFYTLHSSSSNNNILLLGKHRIEFTDIKPTFEQYCCPY